MADYNIYIHSDNVTEKKSPTRPWASTGSRNPTVPWKDNTIRAVNVAQNPDSLVSGAFSKAVKAVPAVAVAYAVIKLIDKVTSTVIDFKTIATGDYSSKRAYNNFKTGLKVVFNPISSSINYFKNEIIDRNTREASKLNLALLGDTYINGFNGYGV